LDPLVEVVTIETRFDLLLPSRQIIKGGIRIVLVELPQPQQFRHGLVFGPAHRREARAPMSDAGQHQEQSQLGQPTVTERGAEAQLFRDLLEHRNKYQMTTTSVFQTHFSLILRCQACRKISEIPFLS
jgi:hypothetical protein